MKPEVKEEGKRKEKIELRTTTSFTLPTAARRISELRRALHQSEILRQKSIKRTEAYKAECCKIRKILSKCEDELVELKDRESVTQDETTIPKILSDARSEASKLRSELNTTQAERDHYRTSYERLCENGSVNQTTLMEEIKRLQVENGKMSTLLSAKTRGLSNVTAKSNENARHNEGIIHDLKKRCKIMSDELKKVSQQRDDLLSERKRVEVENKTSKRIYEENEVKMKEMRNLLHGTEKDLQMANQIIESLHERVTAAETCGPRGALMSSFETQIRELRDGFEKEKKALESRIETVESRERALLKARDRDIEIANQKCENACSRARDMEARLGLLVAGESDDTMRNLRVENEKLREVNGSMRESNERLRAENENVLKIRNVESEESLEIEKHLRKSLDKETRAAKRLAGEWSLGQLEHAQALESLRSEHSTEILRNEEKFHAEIKRNEMECYAKIKKNELECHAQTERDELEHSLLRSRTVRDELERSVLRSRQTRSRIEEEKEQERERLSIEYRDHLEISRRELAELRSNLETASQEATIQQESFESLKRENLLECESLRDSVKMLERQESETLSSLQARLAKSIQMCASLRSQIKTQRMEFQRVLRVEISRICESFQKQGDTKLSNLSSRLSTLSVMLSRTKKRKRMSSVTTQTSSSWNVITPHIERRDEMRIPTEPTPAATTTPPSFAKKRIEWIDNDVRFSVEDSDEVVVDQFDDQPKPSSLSFQTPPRRKRRSSAATTTKEIPDMITPKIVRKSASIPCDSPETEAALFRKLQDISRSSDRIFESVAPSTPSPQILRTTTTCYPEQLSPEQTVALMKRVMSVSIPYITTTKDDAQIARAFQLGASSVSKSQDTVDHQEDVVDTRRTYTFI